MISSVSGPGIFYLAAAAPARRPENFAVPPVPGTTVMVAPVPPVAPVGALIAGDAMAQLQALDLDWTRDRETLSAAKAAGAYGLASMPEVATLSPVPPQAPLRAVGELGFIPGDVFHSEDPTALTAHAREQVAEIRSAARREAALGEARGEPVKLAFDPETGREVVLTKADADFDRIKSAAQVYAQVKYDLPKMGLSLADFQDLLRG
jgi:hypothetical protein